MTGGGGTRQAAATAPGETAVGDPATAARLAEAVAGVDAPDVVFAVTRGGLRTVATGGTSTSASAPTPRESLRYELGSASKTFAGLLLVELARSGALAPDDPLTGHLPGVRPRHASARRITLRQLATHTSGLPRIPADLVPDALLHPHVNSYARYDTERLLHAFARTRPRFRPGSRWRYSNFGAALLGSALAHAAGATPAEYPAVLEQHVLRPLGLADTGLSARPSDAVGHRADGKTPAVPADMAAFSPAGSVRSTPADLLTYLEALLSPGSGALPTPLRDVQVPLLRFGRLHRDVRTPAWIQHPAPGGPLLFHAGATFGQQSFLGFHPATGTGLAALATRRIGALGGSAIGGAYELLYELAAESAH